MMLKDIITAELLNGVLDELLGVIPVVIPVAISFLAVRKAISFVWGMLQSA